jgi:NADPH2:quinone reductase
VISSTGGTGAYAEQVAAPADGLLSVPESLGLPEAVALLADGRTAIALVRSAQIERGETVLVEAAAGGVGSLLVQLARNAGATVVAAAGEPRKLELAAELGAEMAVDYTEDGWAKLVREQLGGVDVVFDGVGGAVARSAFGLVRAGGRFCGFGLASGTWAQLPEADGGDVTVLRGTGMTPDESLELTRAALAEATAGRLRPVIGQTFPLERAADAHAAIEARATIGKTLLIVAPETDGR